MLLLFFYYVVLFIYWYLFRFPKVVKCLTGTIKTCGAVEQLKNVFIFHNVLLVENETGQRLSISKLICSLDLGVNLREMSDLTGLFCMVTTESGSHLKKAQLFAFKNEETELVFRNDFKWAAGVDKYSNLASIIAAVMWAGFILIFGLDVSKIFMRMVPSVIFGEILCFFHYAVMIGAFYYICIRPRPRPYRLYKSLQAMAIEKNLQPI